MQDIDFKCYFCENNIDLKQEYLNYNFTFCSEACLTAFLLKNHSLYPHRNKYYHFHYIYPKKAFCNYYGKITDLSKKCCYEKRDFY